MHVVLAARDPEEGEDAARKLRDEGLEVTSEQLDVADAQSVEDCVLRLADAGTEIDVSSTTQASTRRRGCSP
jgi:NADP-dependent 3-hydroxy acid dehydrogenase YdfG